MDYSGHAKKEASPLELELDMLELDVVALEYFAHAPFDDRVESLLSAADKKTTSLAIKRTDLTPILKGEFEPIAYEHGEPILHYSIESMSDGDKPYQFSLMAQANIPDLIVATADPSGSFMIYSRRSERSFEMSGLETAKLVFRAVGFSEDILDEMITQTDDDQLHNSPDFQKLIIHAWQVAGESNDFISDEYFISETMHDDIRHKQANLRLGFTKAESETNSTITLTLEKAFVYPELEAEEAYRLQATYEVKQLTSEKAEKSIRGDGGLSLKSLETIHLDQGGKKTPLDTTDPAVMQDFIEAYEVLLQSTS